MAVLPHSYAVALRLRESGQPDLIAAALGIPLDSVAPLLRIADDKLAELMSASAKDALSSARGGGNE